MFFSFEKTIPSRGYHIYKNTLWSTATVSDKVVRKLETKKESLDINHYPGAAKIKNKYFEHLITAGHIPDKDISLLKRKVEVFMCTLSR